MKETCTKVSPFVVDPKPIEESGVFRYNLHSVYLWLTINHDSRRY